MRKGALLLALLFAVAATTSADAAKKKMAKPAADPAVKAQQETAALLGDLLHPWAPSAGQSAAKPRAKKKKKM